MNDKNYKFSTTAIRSGISRGHEGEHSTPIFATSSFVFESAGQAAARFAGEEPGNIYSRFSNPTVRAFEERIACLEEAEWGIATASGMAALTTLVLGLCKAGDRIVASRNVFGSINVLLGEFIPRYGIEVVWVDLIDSAAWAEAVTPETRLLFLETPSNPLTELADITELASLAKANDALLVIDNCFCTPALQQPLTLGADLVMHSATKFLDGQGRCIGGVIVGSDPELYQEIFKFHKSAGAAMSPFNAWVFFKGLETLELRVREQCRTAKALATWLNEQGNVAKVFHPSLPDHPQHALACEQQRDFGAIVSFEVTGGRDAAWKVIDNTQMLSITANLGDVRSTITHPATTTHGKLDAAERQRAKISDGLIRVAVGLEALEDIQADLVRGL